MARNRGEMGHKKESIKWRPRHDGRGDNVIARVREERERDAQAT